MMYMLDTNIIIYLMKDKPQSVRQKINSLPDYHQLCMSFVSYGELLKGAYGSQNPEKARRDFELFAQIIPVLPSHQDMPEHYGKWHNILKKQGKPIGNNDLWIAAHALSLNAILVTHNTQEFQRIGDLKLEDWVLEN